MNDNRLLQSALSYAALGWPVIPLHSIRDGACTCANGDCGSPGKHPRTANGLKDASTDPAAIARWWNAQPDSNIGIATGATAGIIAIDIDPRHGGNESLADLVHEFGLVPSTIEAETGGGGEHRIFSHPGGVIRNRANLRPGIDVRGDGGYIVVAPSVHVSGREYRWRDGQGPHQHATVPLPPWLFEMLAEGAHRNGRMPRAATTTSDEQNLLLEAAARYVLKSAPAAAGSRNDAAFNLAGHLAAFETDVTHLRLSEVQILDLLRPWNHRNNPPLSERELAQAVNSAMSNGTPRAPHIVRLSPYPGTDRTDRRASVSSVSPPTDDSPESWPDPQSLPDELPPVSPFNYDLLPASMRRWIQDIAERIQCPPDFPAVAAMISLAAVVGRKIGIRPKRHDDWLVVPNLWGAVIGPPSVMKTPAVQEPLRALKRLEIEAKKEFDVAVQEHEAKELVAEQRKQRAKRAIRDALDEDGGDPLAAARDALRDDSGRPVRRRYLVNDATVEKLGEILNENPNGVLCHRDELIGLLKSLDKEVRARSTSKHGTAPDDTPMTESGAGRSTSKPPRFPSLAQFNLDRYAPISTERWPTALRLMA